MTTSAVGETVKRETVYWGMEEGGGGVRMLNKVFMNILIIRLSR